MDPPQTANAAQLAARKLAQKPKKRLGATGGFTSNNSGQVSFGAGPVSFGGANNVFGNSTGNMFGAGGSTFAPNGSSLFGGGAASAAAAGGGGFNFSAPNGLTMSFSPTPPQQQAQAVHPTQTAELEDYREDTTGEEAARKNKTFTISGAGWGNTSKPLFDTIPSNIQNEVDRFISENGGGPAPPQQSAPAQTTSIFQPSTQVNDASRSASPFSFGSVQPQSSTPFTFGSSTTTTSQQSPFNFGASSQPVQPSPFTFGQSSGNQQWQGSQNGEGRSPSPFGAGPSVQQPFAQQSSNNDVQSQQQSSATTKSTPTFTFGVTSAPSNQPSQQSSTSQSPSMFQAVPADSAPHYKMTGMFQDAPAAAEDMSGMNQATSAESAPHYKMTGMFDTGMPHQNQATHNGSFGSSQASTQQSIFSTNSAQAFGTFGQNTNDAQATTPAQNNQQAGEKLGNMFATQKPGVSFTFGQTGGSQPLSQQTQSNNVNMFSNTQQQANTFQANSSNVGSSTVTSDRMHSADQTQPTSGSLFSRITQPDAAPANTPQQSVNQSQQSLSNLFSSRTTQPDAAQSPAPEQPSRQAQLSSGSLFSRITAPTSEAPSPFAQQPVTAAGVNAASSKSQVDTATDNSATATSDLPSIAPVEPISNPIASSNNIFAATSTPSQEAHLPAKPVVRPLTNGNAAPTSVGQKTKPHTTYERLTDIAIWNKEQANKYMPNHFSDEQKADYIAIFRVRSLNAAMKAYLSAQGPCTDLTDAMSFYSKTHAEIQQDRNQKKRKAGDKDILQTESSPKRSKATPATTSTGTQSQQPQTATTAKQNLFAPSKPSPLSNVSTSSEPTPVVPPVSFTPAPPTNSTPAASSPQKAERGKRKADVQITKDNPTDDPAEALTSKQAKPNSSSAFTPSMPATPVAPPTTPAAAGAKSKRKAETQITKDNPDGEEGEHGRPPRSNKVSNTMTRMRDILEKPAPANETPTKSNPFAALPAPSSASKSSATPNKQNPFASLGVPSTAPPAITKTSAFSFTPSSGTSGQPLFGNVNVSKPQAEQASNSIETTSNASSGASNAEVPASTNMFAAKALSSVPSTTSNLFAAKSGPGLVSSSSANMFAAKSAFLPPGSSATQSSAPGINGSSTNFLSQFGARAEKDKAAAEAKAMQDAKDEDMDSDEDEAEWEARYKAKRDAEKKALDAAKAATKFIPKQAVAPVNFLSQFGQQAQKDREAAELKAMEAAKDEDMDSDEDEAEWEARYKAKREAEKKAVESAAKSRPMFVPGKGFSLEPQTSGSAGDVAKDNPPASKPLFGAAAAETPTADINTPSVSNTTNIFAQSAGPRAGSSLNQSLFAPKSTQVSKTSLFQLPPNSGVSSPFIASSRSGTSSPAAASSTGSIFDSQEAKKPAAFENIFSHVSDPGADSAPDHSSDEEEHDDQENSDPNEEKRDPTYQPEKDDGSQPGTPAEETGAGIASAQKSSSIFNFAPAAPSSTPANKSGSAIFGSSTPATGTSTPTGGLFGRITRDKDGNALRQVPPENKENASPAVSNSFGTSSIFGASTSSNIFGSTNKVTGAQSSAPVNNTWSQNTPIKFGSAPSTSTPPEVSVTAATPEKASPFAGFGSIPTPKPSLFAGFGATASAKPTPFANPPVGQEKPATFSFLGSTAATPSTSRATTPGGTTDNDTTSEANDPEAEVLEQIDLTSTAAGEEDEDCVFTVRSKAMKFSASSDKTQQWVTKGLGPLKVLKHKTTGAGRILLRADPSGTIVLNKSILGKVNYEATKKTVKVLTADDGGKGLETWLLQVKTEDLAKELAAALETNKS